jgi:hypothetical protein
MAERAKPFRRTLAQVLRRWADWVLTEEPTPLTLTPDRVRERMADQQDSVEGTTLAGGRPPDSGEVLGADARRKPGQPPTHWLEVVRRAAPDLIRPAQDRMVTYRVGAPPQSHSVEENRGKSLTKLGDSTSAHVGRPLPEGRPSLPDTTKGPLAALREYSHAPAVEMPGTTNDQVFSRPSSQAGQAGQPDSRRSQPRTRQKEPGNVAEPSRDSVRETRLVDTTRSPEQEAFPSPARQESALPSRPQSGAPEVKRSEPSLLRQPLEEAEKTVRQTQTPIEIPQGQAFVSRTATPSSDVAQFVPTIEESRDVLPTAISPTPRPRDKGRNRSKVADVGGSKQDVQTAQIPEQKSDPWPELPANLSRASAPSPTAIPARTGVQAGAPDVLSPTGWSLRAEGRWPELLQEPPAAVDEWEESLRSQERRDRLDREQLGGA